MQIISWGVIPGHDLINRRIARCSEKAVLLVIEFLSEFGIRPCQSLTSTLKT